MNKKEYYQIRETRKIGLQTFFTNVQNNNYDSITNTLIVQLKTKLSDLNDKKSILRNQELSDCALEIYFLERELLEISEMKIIYAFKNFETHLIWLLKASYKSEHNKRIYKWETIKYFLISKNIQLSSIDDLKERMNERTLEEFISKLDSSK